MTREEIRTVLGRLDGAPADALESEILEFKPWIAARDACRRQVRVLREAAVAMANARGGVVIVGVADRKRTRAGAIHGVGDLDMEGLRRDIYDGTDPHLLVDIEAIEEPEGRVLVLRIPRGLGLHTTTDGVARLRVGKDSKPLTGSGIARAVAARQLVDLTAVAVPDASISDLDPEQIERLRRVIAAERGDSSLARLPDMELLRALDLASASGVSRAAILLLGASAALARLVPNHEIIFARYGSTEPRYDARRDLRMPLLQQLDECEALLRSHTGLTTVPLEGFRDLEVPDISRWAAREAILNAVCHRDWFVSQSVHVSLHPDRLEVESPGGFIEGVSPKNVIRHPPARRNPLLAHVLQSIGLVNRAGLGVDRLYEESLRAGKGPPRYRATASYVRLVLYTRTSVRFAAFVARERRRGRTLSLDDLLLLDRLTREPHLDRWSAAECLDLKEARAAERLRSLRERGYVAPEGRGAGTKYRLAGDLASLSDRLPLLGGELTMRQRVLQLVRERGSITNSDVRRHTGLTRYRAVTLLRNLRADGLLAMRGSRRGARYVPGPGL